MIINDHSLAAESDEFEQLVLGVASGNATIEEVRAFFESRCTPIE